VRIGYHLGLIEFSSFSLAVALVGPGLHNRLKRLIGISC